MISLEDLMQRCISQNTNPQNRSALQSTLQKLQAHTTRPAMHISPACADRIEQAAAAAQSGDRARAAQLMQEILATPEGAALAQQLQFLLKQ